MTWSYTLTLGATPVALSSVIPAADVTRVRAAKFLSVQPDGGNGGPLYVGGSNAGALTSSTNYGFRLEGGASGVPPAPFIWEDTNAASLLSEFWVAGATGLSLHIFLKD